MIPSSLQLPLPRVGEEGWGERARDIATGAQLAASDPAVSAFVAASAGSGKTKLLTDRLLRLLLAGTNPERILCLTFTRAAAAEMALRLQHRLGEWVRLPDAALDAKLKELAIVPDADARRRARELFAKVLDVPGGMRVGTIHAFCQSLLRRFPLEAALSPHFQLLEEADAADAWNEAREDMLAGANSADATAALEVVARLAASMKDFGCRIGELDAERERLGRLLERDIAAIEAAQRRVLRVTAANEATVIAKACHSPDETTLREAAEIVLRSGANGCAGRARSILEWLDRAHEHRCSSWSDWGALFLRQDGKLLAASTFVNGRLGGSHPHLGSVFLGEAERVLAVQEACQALRVAEASSALIRLAAPVLRNYAERKSRSAQVDYEDLIGHTQALLHDPGAAWVLYKLDGGLDHLLLDEVQDTAPAQWKLAHALVAEFFAGQGVREGTRTVFAVGDRKQSIYSFQGADVAAFDGSRSRLEALVRGAGQVWRDLPLAVSFRSTVPVLKLVDAVFDDPVTSRGVVDGEPLRHLSDRPGQAGSVELWPLAPLPQIAEPPRWAPATNYVGQTSAPQMLADGLAEWIAAETSGSAYLLSRGRALRPGDVLVLVRRRNAFGHALVRALKARGVPVGGLDRLVLTEQPAVQDLLALCDALLLPEDDLSFACYLTSPLGGLSDDSLMALGMERDGTLWETLRDRAGKRPDWQAAWEMFAALRARVDYVSPHALLSEALGVLGGHARLFARLGPEAGEPVDELLNAALKFARTHPPSLQGFLHWLRQSASEIQREQEQGGGGVRVMTVHGAKGLQAPLVILPDTTSLPPAKRGLVWAREPNTGWDVPLWGPRKAVSCQVVDDLGQAERRRDLEEYNRLLYVALTRAEDRLVICGWNNRNPAPPECWYRAVERGFARLEGVREAFGEWGEKVSFGCRQAAEPDRIDWQALSSPSLEPPVWLGRAPDWKALPPPAEPVRPVPLAPSKPEGVELGPVPGAASPFGGSADRFARGRLIHSLLQYLPELGLEQRADAARAWLDRTGHELADEDAEGIVADTLGVLAHPELSDLFGPGSRAEVPVTGLLGDAVVGALVDRLVVLPDRVMVADFKTNRRAPTKIEDTPVLYLRQMAAYRGVLRQVFPEREVRCALIWTHTGQVTVLDDGLLDAACSG